MAIRSGMEQARDAAIKELKKMAKPVEGRSDIEQVATISAESEELGRIRTWADSTRDGTLSGMPFQPTNKVWLQVCSEAHSCTQRYCGPRGNCWFQEARKAAADAKLVVVNHTLFFALLNTGEMARDEEGEKMQGFLFPNDFAVLDEAHTVEQVAAVQLHHGSLPRCAEVWQAEGLATSHIVLPQPLARPAQLMAPGQPVAHRRQTGRPRAGPRLTPVGRVQKRIHAGDAQPAERFRLPFPHPAVYPGQVDKVGVTAEREVGQRPPGKV
jgi:hypothetical protein